MTNGSGPSARDPLVTGYEPLIPSLTLPDENDRHVLAAAIKCNADALVTFNLKHFPADVVEDQWDIEVQHPDEFLVHQITLSTATVCRAAKNHRQLLKNPPKSAREYLNGLENTGLPSFISLLEEYEDLI